MEQEELFSFIFFVHFPTGHEIVVMRNVGLDYAEGVEKRTKECNCTEMITWVCFDKQKKVVKSGIINKKEE